MPVDDAAFQAAFDALIVRIGAAGAVAVKTAALAVQASGMVRTPVQSGTLRRSWHTTSVGPYEANVGPTMIYARRIELGFEGPDSLGRVYHQAPKPYVRPAYDETFPQIRPFFVTSIAAAIRG